MSIILSVKLPYFTNIHPFAQLDQLTISVGRGNPPLIEGSLYNVPTSSHS